MLPALFLGVLEPPHSILLVHICAMLVLLLSFKEALEDAFPLAAPLIPQWLTQQQLLFVKILEIQQIVNTGNT